MANYSVEELKEFADGISMKLCSLRSAQHWKYDEETANRIIWLDRLYDKIKDDIEHKNKEEKIGHWVEEVIDKCGRKVFCSKCGYSAPFEYVSSGDVYSASGYGVINKTKFCPDCGAKMIE